MGSLIDAPAPGRLRRNQGSDAVRGRLVEAAIEVFAARGFDGASTRAIAEVAGAHQSQIRYHFASKDDLWRAVVGLLTDELRDAIAQRATELPTSARDEERFRAAVTGLVVFVAVRPELHRILLHESTEPGPRLTWLVETHVREFHDALLALWRALDARGRVVSMHEDLVMHVLLGAASLVHVNAAEGHLLGLRPAAELVDDHVDALMSMFLRPESDR